jgi:L-amino acid N-acyltransferase YncA
MHLRDAEETDLPAIRDIYNDAVLNTTADLERHAGGSGKPRCMVCRSQAFSAIRSWLR